MVGCNRTVTSVSSAADNCPNGASRDRTGDLLLANLGGMVVVGVGWPSLTLQRSFVRSMMLFGGGCFRYVLSPCFVPRTCRRTRLLCIASVLNVLWTRTGRGRRLVLLRYRCSRASICALVRRMATRIPLWPIERFVWTTHALLRLDERCMSQSDVENAIRDGHGGSQINEGQADWLIEA